MLFKSKTIFSKGIILLAAVLWLGNAAAQDHNSSAGVFLRMGVGARAMSMGGAFVGLADDPSATYWNAAGMHQIQNLQFEFMNVKLPFDRSFNFFSSVIPVKSYFNLGISWLGLQVSDIESRSSNSAAPDNIFSSGQNALFISLAKSLTPRLAIGGNVKLIRNTLDNLSATGVGFDASILLKPWQQFQLGLLVQNFRTDYSWNIDYSEQVPITYRIGAAWQIYQGFIIVADINKTSSLASKYHFGCEFRPLSSFPIRLGLNENQLSVGSGIEMPLTAHKLEVNYAYSKDQIFHDTIHRVSLLFSVDENSNQIHAPKNDDLPRVNVETKISESYSTNKILSDSKPDLKNSQIDQIHKQPAVSSKTKNNSGLAGPVTGAFRPGNQVVVHIHNVSKREEKSLSSILEAIQNKYQREFIKRRFRKHDYVFAFVPESLPELKNVLKVMLRIFNSKRLKVYTAKSG